MTAGVSIESYSADAVFSGSGFDANYPAANLGDLTRSTKVGRIPGGSSTITATLATGPDSVPLVGFVAVVNHTLQPGDTLRVQAGSYDSGVVSAWPGAYVAGYRPVRPFIFPEAATSTVTITVSAAGSVDLGGIEIGRFWSWPGLSPGVEVGFRHPAPQIDYAGGGGAGPDLDPPRIYNGQIDRISMAQTATRGLDFQGLKGTARPFVFVENYEDADSWARTCFLARNLELPPAVGAVYRHDTFQIRLTEWIR